MNKSISIVKLRRLNNYIMGFGLFLCLLVQIMVSFDFYSIFKQNAFIDSIEKKQYKILNDLSRVKLNVHEISHHHAFKNQETFVLIKGVKYNLNELVTMCKADSNKMKIYHILSKVIKYEDEFNELITFHIDSSKGLLACELELTSMAHDIVNDFQNFYSRIQERKQYLNNRVRWLLRMSYFLMFFLTLLIAMILISNFYFSKRINKRVVKLQNVITSLKTNGLDHYVNMEDDIFDEFHDVLDMLEDLMGKLRLKNNELKEAKDLYSLVVESTNDGFWDWNLKTNDAYFSPRYYTMLGFQPGEFHGTFENWKNLLHPDDIERTKSCVEKNIKEGLPQYEVEFRMKMKNGSWKWIEGRGKIVEWDELGNPVRMVGVHTDIDQRKKIENELRKTRNYLKNIFDSSPSVMISIDEKGKVTQWNQAAVELTGMSGVEVLGKNFWDVSSYFVGYKNIFADVIEKRKKISLYRQRIAKNSKNYYDVTLFPLIANGVKGAAIRLDDVTEMESKDIQLKQAQKMEVVGNLAGGLAHDFNNILGGIVGSISLLKSMKTDEKSLKFLNLMERSVKRAEKLVNQLLSISKKQELNMEYFDIRESLNNVIKVCENTFDKSVRIETDWEEKQYVVKGDMGQIEQVVLNLCLNSFHAMTIMRKPFQKMGGLLKITLEEIYADEFFCRNHAEASRDENYIFIQVRDSGVGIHKKYLTKIFDPFFSTKDKSKGTGLGLSMVYSIIKQHRGFIDVYSEVNVGTTISIFLPKAYLPKGIKNEAPSESRIYKGEGTVLVIDDEDGIRSVAEGMLEYCGYDVILARDGYEGVELFKQGEKSIKAILLDMSMPNMSGKEAYYILKEISPRVKIIMTSGFKQDSRVLEVLDAGAEDFIQKPFTLQVLSRVVHNVLNSG